MNSQNGFSLDLDNVDLTPYLEQVGVSTQQEEPGFVDKALNTASATLEGITRIPGGIYDTAVATYRGGDFDASDPTVMADIEKRMADKAEFAKKYEGKTLIPQYAEGVESLPYSLTTLGGSIAGAALGTAAAGPAGGIAAGAATSGTIGYRASYNDFMEGIALETKNALGRLPTSEEWKNVQNYFASAAQEYGGAEAAGEAIGNLLFAKILGPIGNLAKGGVKGALSKIAAGMGEEVGSETLTQMGQSHAEASAGLRDEMQGPIDAAGEVFWPTVTQTALMGGAHAAGGYAYNKYRGLQTQAEPLIEEPEAIPLQGAPLALPAGGAIVMGTESTGMGPIPQPSGSNSPTVSTPEGAKPDPVIESMSAGKPVDLLQGVPGAVEVDSAENQDDQQIDAVRRLGFTSVDRGLSNPSDDADFISIIRTIPSSDTERRKEISIAWEQGRLMAGDTTRRKNIEGVAETPEKQAQLTPLSGVIGMAKAQDAAPAIPQAMPAQVQQPVQQPASTPAPVAGPAPTPARAVPTQAQITSTQEAPRADTMAQAKSLGMPAPTPVPAAEQQPMPAQAQPAAAQPVAATPVPSLPERQATSGGPAQMAQGVPEVSSQEDAARQERIRNVMREAENGDKVAQTLQVAEQLGMRGERRDAIESFARDMAQAGRKDLADQVMAAYGRGENAAKQQAVSAQPQEQPQAQIGESVPQQQEQAQQEEVPGESDEFYEGVNLSDLREGVNSPRLINNTISQIRENKAIVPQAIIRLSKALKKIGRDDIAKRIEDAYNEASATQAHSVQQKPKAEPKLKKEPRTAPEAEAKEEPMPLPPYEPKPEMKDDSDKRKELSSMRRSALLEKLEDKKAARRMSKDEMVEALLKQEGAKDTSNTPADAGKEDSSVAADGEGEENTPAQKGGQEEEQVQENKPATGRDYGNADAPNIDALGDYFSERLLSGHKYKNILEARREAFGLIGVKGPMNTAKLNKTIEESIELGVVRAARNIAGQAGKAPVEVYRDLVDLYNRQPNLATRTSTSIDLQQYSTPVPLAYLADRLAGVDGKSTVYEPTAGNGALLITANPKNAVVNELDTGRADRLRAQGFTVTQNDALAWSPAKKVDAVVTNPPFGPTKDGEQKAVTFTVLGLETRERDHVIALNALDKLNENGKAVLIIGGKKVHGKSEDRSQKYRSASQTGFYQTLFDNFNVVDHFTVDGDLYSRQGASFPIDFIVIDGHHPTENPVFPAGKLPRVYNTFEELEEVLSDERMVYGSQRNVGVSGDRGEGNSQSVGSDESDSEQRGRLADGGRPRGTTGNNTVLDEGIETVQQGVPGTGHERVQGRGTVGNAVRDHEHSRPDGTGRGVNVPTDGRSDVPGKDGTDGQGSGGRQEGKLDGVGNAGRAGVHRSVNESENADSKADSAAKESDPVTPSGVPSDEPVPTTKEAKAAAPKPKSTSTQAAYDPASSGFQLGTLVPNNMRTPVQSALERIRKANGGDIDGYVAKELGYKDADEMHKYFAAEQVDALAMALDNISSGKGFVLGDQTGIGKGRVCAGIIRWAKKNGKTPIFVTMLNDLYADMKRDLDDIGSEGFTPFITNSEMTGKKALMAPDGSALGALPKSQYNKAMRAMVNDGKLIDGVDGIFTTYNQLQSRGEKAQQPRRDLLDALKRNAVLILDEAHNAGGAKSSIGLYMREYTANMQHGVLYSSATFAKRPDVMSLYNKTDISLIGSQEDIEDTARKGGLSMQQAISAMLTESGQYIRREKSFEGAEMATSVVNVDGKTADGMASCMDKIMALSNVIYYDIKRIDKELKARGKAVSEGSGTGRAGASSTSFGSVMHNLVGQATLAIKADAVIDEAERAVKNGEKPIITLSNTMGSFIQEYVADNNIKQGERVNLNFGDLFTNYLNKCLIVHEKGAGEKRSVPRVLEMDELSDISKEAHSLAKKVIKNTDFSKLPISPIDYIIDNLKKRGISASEITGRTYSINYTDEGPILRMRATGAAVKQGASSGFNSGDIDCLIINRSGSTGISLHASEKFMDKKRRSMIILQPDLDIDVFMQTLGRVFRTGQVVPPKYVFLMSNMPSEQRPAAVLGKKMASLNANTTASSKGTQSFENIPDFLNAYGDQAAYEVLSEDEELNTRLGGIIASGESKTDSEDGAAGRDGLVAKLTGRIPLLSLKEQADVYDRITEAYNGIVDMANSMGTNILDTKAKPLDAVLKKSSVLTAKQDGASAFSAASYLGEYDVKVLGKPFTSQAVKEHVAEGVKNAPDIFAIRSAADSYLEEKAKSTKNQEEEARLSAKVEQQKFLVTNTISSYPAGSVVRLEGMAGRFHGIVVGFTSKQKKAKKDGPENPVIPSQWKMVVDVADAKRRFSIPFSKLVFDDGEVMGEKLRIETPYNITEGEVYARYDSAQSESREKRAIITGNIVAGFTKIGRGEIITFDTRDGRRIMGVMLPKDMKADETLKDLPVEFDTVPQVMEFLDRAVGSTLIHGDKEKIGMYRTGSDNFILTVPAKKDDGAKYFLDRGLIEALGTEFNKSGKSMVATYLSRERASNALQYLKNRGVTFYTNVAKDVARKVTGKDAAMSAEQAATDAISDAVSFASISERENGNNSGGRRPVDGGRGSIRRTVEALGRKAQSAAPVTVVNSFTDLPTTLRIQYAGNENTLEAAYMPSEGRVYMVADNIGTGIRAAEVWAHEQVVHHGLRSMMNENERRAMLNQLWQLSGGMENKGIADIASRYGINPRMGGSNREIVMEEYLASLAESRTKSELKGKDLSVWRQMVKAVQQFLNRVAQAVAGRPLFTAEYVDSLLSSLEANVMGGLPVVRVAAGKEAAYAARSEARRHKAGKVGEITPEIAEKLNLNKPGDIVLDRNALDHIEERHGKELRSAGFKDARELVSYVMDNIDAVYQGNTSRKYEVVAKAKEPHSRAVIRLEFSPNGDFYRVVTAGPASGNRYKNETPLWESAHHSQSGKAESRDDTPRITGQSGVSGENITPNTAEGKAKRDNEEAPLASISGTTGGFFAKPLEWEQKGIDKLFALARKGADKISGTEKARADAGNENISMFASKKDLSLLRKLFSLPHFIAKKFPGFRPIYERQLKRMEERQAAYINSIKEIPTLFGDKRVLNDKDMDDLRSMIHATDGVELKETLGTEKFTVKDTLANGREIIEPNKSWYAGYEKWLEKQKASSNAKKAMLELRKSLDKDLATINNRMAAMSEMSDTEIDKFRTSIGEIHNYFPHHRYGKYYVQVISNEQVVYRQHFDAPSRELAKKKGYQLIAKLKKEYSGASFRVDENKEQPEEMFEAPLKSEAIEQLISRATNAIEDKEQAKQVREALNEAVADAFKERGFGSHGITRKNIPGYEMDDILRVISDYKSGLTGWLTKIEAAQDFSKALGNINSTVYPREWAYAKQYVQDMLRNSDRVDKIAGNIKSAAFMWFLGGNIKTAVVNLTQNIIVGVPRLQMDISKGFGARRYFEASNKAILDFIKNGESKALDDEERKLINELYNNNVISDAYMKEIRGRVSDSTWGKTANKFMKFAGMPMSIAERYNRASLALAAFKAAKDGHLTPEIAKEFGIKGNATYEQAKKYAEKIVYDAHFVYGEQNQPEFMRSTAFGRALSPALVFRSFSMNLLSLYAEALRSRGQEGRIFVAKSLAATTLMGGIASFPFFATAMALGQAISGDDDDWLEKIRGALPENDLLRDIVTYGMPSIAGINIGGSLQMETPFTQGLSKGTSVKEVTQDTITAAIGIPYAFIEMADKSVKAVQGGNAYRAIEELAPMFIRNAMAAYRLATEGQKTMKGKAISNPGEHGPRKLSTAEAAGKALGFQPVSSTKSYDRYQAQKRSDSVRSDKINDVTLIWLNGMDTKDSREFAKARKEIREWNAKMKEDGKPWMTFNLEDVQRRAKARRKQHKGNQRTKARSAQQDAIW